MLRSTKDYVCRRKAEVKTINLVICEQSFDQYGHAIGFITPGLVCGKMPKIRQFAEYFHTKPLALRPINRLRWERARGSAGEGIRIFFSRDRTILSYD